MLRESGVSASDVRKYEYAVQETKGADPFASGATLVAHVKEARLAISLLVIWYGVRFQAVQWQAAHSASEVIELRETVMDQLEEANRRMNAAGICSKWLEGCDEEVTKLSRNVNGHLFGELMCVYDYHDASCVELLRNGSSLLPTIC